MKARADCVRQTGMTRWILAAATALVVVLFAVAGARAQDELDKGLDVGQTIPAEMAAPDQNGDVRSLKSLIGRSGLVLLFTRSLDW